MVEKIIRKVLMEMVNHPMRLKESVKISDELKYHLDKQIPLNENMFKEYSKSFINLINEVRSLYNKNLIDLNDEDRSIVESDLGKKVLLENGQVVYLEVPTEDQSFLNEAEYQGRKVQLGKIMQGDVKKFKVYVKNDKGNVVKVNFGFGGKSAKGKRMVIKKNNPQRRKSFRARHNCDNPGPRWKARYWACKTW
jgi:D-Tyr-tRNAtyr deacylase